MNGVMALLGWYRRGRRRVDRVLNRSRWVRWLLGLPFQPGTTTTPGLVLIQIDGLARIQFERALKKRRMPFLHSLIRRHGYTIHSHYSGLPSSTPAVQAEIMYGVKCAVPAFDFHDVTTGDYRCMFESASAAVLQEGLERGNPAVLQGGSAYCNIYTGGAEEPHFCASRLGWNSIRARLNPLRAAAIVVLYFDAMVRIAALIALELVLTLVDFVLGLGSGFKLRSELFMVPARVVVSIIMREWSTLGAEVDIYRGLPVVQINYLGYDEQSHRRGPSSRYAHWTLKGIDDSIKRLWSATKRGAKRPYHFWIYSDHGQEASIPYHVVAGRPLDVVVKEVLANIGVTAYSPWHRHALSRAGRATWVRDRKPSHPNAFEPAAPDTTSPEPCLTSKGPVAHLYVAGAARDPDRDRIARALVEHANIPVVMARHGSDRALAWTRAGRFMLPEQAADVVGTKHPFPQEIGPDLVSLMHHSHAGNFILLGWRQDGSPISFPDEYGAHAGPGYRETHGFALLPPDAPLRTNGRDYLRPMDLREAVLRVRPPVPPETEFEPHIPAPDFNHATTRTHV